MLNVRSDVWLGERMGKPAFRVEPDGDAGSVTTSISEHASTQNLAFYFAKVDAGRVDIMRALGVAGFFVADVNVTFDRPAATRGEGARSPDFTVSPCEPGDTDEVLRIAHTAFRFTRFHLDPLIPKSIANGIKREWIVNYVKKSRGDALLVARLGGRPIGFLAALRAGDAAVIDLVAVDSDYQARGIGCALVEGFADHYRASSKTSRVGTQAANVPSIRLYEKQGFRLTKSEYVLHLHVREGRPEV